MANSSVDHWTIGEKNKLLHLLYSYPYNAYNHLSKKLRSKTPEQIQQFIEKLVCGANNQKKFKTVKDQVHRAPLEEWKEIATDMTSLDKVDSSTNLSKVFSIISAFEDFPQGPDDPNYKAIYTYLSQCLQHDRKEDVDTLGPLESAVLLDLLHSLMPLLGENDLSVQRNVMRWKYLLLDYRDSMGKSNNLMLRKAAENDFKEFIEDLYDQDHDKKGLHSATGKLPGLPTPVKVCQDTAKVLVADVLGKTPVQLPTASSAISATASNVAFKSDTPSSTSKKLLAPKPKSATVSKAPEESVNKTSNVTSETLFKKPNIVSPLQNSSSVASTTLSSSVAATTATVPSSVYTSSPDLEALPITTAPTNCCPQICTENIDTSTANTSTGSSQPAINHQHSALADLTPPQSTTGTEPNRLVERLNSVGHFMEDSTLKRRHKAGRKGVLDLPETPITEIVLVMPPEGKEIVNYSSRKKGPWRNQHFDGKYKSIDPESEIITNDLSRDYFYEVHRTESDQFYTEAQKSERKRKAKVVKQSRAAHKIQKSIEESQKRKYKELMSSVKDPNAPVKKPKLYTINPFCLPVSLIDLDS